ncbi:alpha/beta hydrolase [Serinibacter salmoneus]|uniref:Phospholipase/carboxylesterase n=1 Tax=Serinibacter salmoneus TaxID=556530 RepID=A0A2A9CZU9_9MICO|nr:phospholipase [Serinibacter salmoneus]PFG19944.1 phospholipase/carboxylesterase [Serinibacter salmoneus]
MRIDHDATIMLPASGAGTDPDAETPLLLVLHGFGANERDLLPLAEYLGHTGPTAFLRAPLALGPDQRAWFPILDIARPDPAAVQAAADAVLAWLAEHHPGRTVIGLGFSQGSTVVLQALRTQPSAFAGVVVLSGFVSPATHDGDSALAGCATPAFFGHGDADPIIPTEVTALTAAWLREHTTLTERDYPGLPHAVDGRELADVRAFLAALA